MGTSPMGVLQLLDSSQVTVSRETTCCKRIYAVTSYQAGSMLRIKHKGSGSYHVKDAQDQMIAEFRFRRPWFKTSSMEVKLCHSPMVTVKPKGVISRSTLIMDETDQQILRIKHTRTFFTGKEYKILGREGMEIGSIRKDWSDYDLLYPLDLDVRYKTALIATIVYNDVIEQERQAAASSS